MNASATYIYGLVDPRDSQVYYIGKSDDPEQRLYQHLHDSVNRHKRKWLVSLAGDGLKPSIKILEVVPADKWAEAETKWIAKGRGGGWPLTNIAAGGPHSPDYHDPYEIIKRIVPDAHWRAFSALCDSAKVEIIVDGARAAVPFLRAWASRELEIPADWSIAANMTQDAIIAGIEKSAYTLTL